MKRLLFCLGALSFALCFSGCATPRKDLSEDQCKQADWENIGKVDARRGRPESYKTNHVRSCDGTSQIDEASYERGWSEGRVDYCEVANGYYVGVRGELVVGSCSAEFEEQYRKGRRVYLLVQERSQVAEQIKTERERIEKDESVLNHVAQAYHLLTQSSPTASLEAREQDLNREIQDLRASAPTQSLAMSSYDSASTVQSSMGAFIGTTLGFGIGHAIQGRYSSSGWKWTLGEVGTITTIAIVSSSVCPSERSVGENGNCSSPWPAVALLGWLGFRVWQSIDLWGHTFRSTQGYDLAKKEETPWSFALAPNGLAWAYSFE